MAIIPHYLILISNCIQFFQQKTHVRKHKRLSVVLQFKPGQEKCSIAPTSAFTINISFQMAKSQNHVQD